MIEGNFEKFLRPDQWYCVDFDTENLQPGGNWDGNFLYFFEFSINVCNRDKDNIKTEECSDYESSKEYLNKRKFLSINFP